MSFKKFRDVCLIKMRLTSCVNMHFWTKLYQSFKGQNWLKSILILVNRLNIKLCNRQEKISRCLRLWLVISLAWAFNFLKKTWMIISWWMINNLGMILISKLIWIKMKILIDCNLMMNRKILQILHLQKEANGAKL